MVAHSLMEEDNRLGRKILTADTCMLKKKTQHIANLFVDTLSRHPSDIIFIRF